MTPKQFVSNLLAHTAIEAQQQYIAAHHVLFQNKSLADEIVACLKQEADARRLQSRGAIAQILETQFLLAAFTNSQLHYASALRSQVNMLAAHDGDFGHALQVINEINEIYIAHDLPIERARIQIIGVLCLVMLQYDDEIILSRYADTKQVLEAHKQWIDLAKLISNFGMWYYERRGKHREALKALNTAIDLYSRQKPLDQTILTRLRHNRNLIRRALGDFNELKLEAEHDLTQLQASNQLVEAAKVRQSIAYCSMLLGNYASALKDLQVTRDLFQATQTRYDEFLVETDIAECLVRLNRFNEVLETGQRIRKLNLDLPIKTGCILLAESIAYSSIANKNDENYQKGLEVLEMARIAFKNANSDYWLAHTELEITTHAYRAEELTTSLQSAKACISTFSTGGQQLWLVQAFVFAARAAIKLHQFEEANFYLTEATAICAEQDWLWLTYQIHYWRGIYYREVNKLQDALQAFEQAVAELEQVTSYLVTEYRPTFLEDKQVLYEDIVDLYLKLDEPQRGLEYAERAKSRALLDLIAYRLELRVQSNQPTDQALIDQLQTLQRQRDLWVRQLQDPQVNDVRNRMYAPQSLQQLNLLERQMTYIWHELLDRYPDYAREAALWQVRTEPIQAQLPSDALLIEYFVIHGKLIVFLVTYDSVQGHHLDVTCAEIEEILEELQHNLHMTAQMPLVAMGHWQIHVETILQALYTRLIRPIDEYIRSFTHIYVVPHNILHQIPFNCLHDGQQYLIEQFTLSRLPSSSMLYYCRESDSSNTPPQFIAFGHAGHPSRPTLPYALQEAQDVAALLDGVAFVAEAATRQQFISMTSTPRPILHVAMHGQYNSETPLFSGLEFDDGDLTALDIFNLRVNSPLIVLSACATGKSVLGGGDEQLGLMRSLLYAGAASLMLTLWSVEDQSTLYWMKSFYSVLKRGESKVDAVRETQLAFITGQYGQRFCHPFYWASFDLIGDIRPIF